MYYHNIILIELVVHLILEPAGTGRGDEPNRTGPIYIYIYIYIIYIYVYTYIHIYHIYIYIYVLHIYI